MLAQNSAAFHQLWLNVVSKCSLFSFKCSSTFGLSGENFSFLVILSGLEAIIQRVYDSTISDVISNGEWFPIILFFFY